MGMQGAWEPVDPQDVRRHLDKEIFEVVRMLVSDRGWRGARLCALLPVRW